MERPAAARRSAEVSIDNFTFLFGIGAIVAAVVGGSCSTNARIGDVRAEVGTLRTEFGGLRAEVGDLRTEVGDLRAEVGDLRAEVGTLRTEFGGLRTEVGDLRTEFGAEIRDVRAEIRDVRARVETLEDSTAASFATVHRQLAAVAVCLLEIRSLVGGDSPDRSGASTACDSAIRAILAPSAPTGR